MTPNNKIIINQNKGINNVFLYQDDELVEQYQERLDGKRCFPHFKPDFSLDTFLSSNYFCHFTIIRKSIVDELNGFRSEYNGAQDYDLFLRVVERTKKIGKNSNVIVKK